MLRKCFLFCFLICSCFLRGQPALNWQVTIGGSEIDYGNDIFQIDSTTSALAPAYRVGVAGRTASMDGTVLNCAAIDTDAFFTQVDTNGAVMSCTTLGGSCFEEFNKGKYVVSSSGQVNVILLGRTCSIDRDVVGNHGAFDAWMVRTDFAGNVISKKCIGGKSWEDIFDFIELPDKGFIMCGVSASDTIDGLATGNNGGFDGWIVRTDSAGNIIWSKQYGGSYSDFIYSISETHDGNYILAGHTNSTDGNIINSHGSFDYWVLKIDTNGSIIWTNVFGGSNNDYGYKIIETDNDYGFLIAGYTYSFNGNVSGNHSAAGSSDAWVLKLDSFGNVVWNKCYGGYSLDVCFSMTKSNSGNSILLIFPDGWNGNPDGCPGTHAFRTWLAKIDSAGNVLWNGCFGSNNNDAFPEALIQMDERNYYFISHPYASTGDVTIAYGGEFDIWLAKFYDNSAPNFIERGISNKEVRIFPNPTSDFLLVSGENLQNSKINIKDFLGQILISKANIGNENIINVGQLKNGVYSIEIVQTNQTLNYKFSKTE